MKATKTATKNVTSFAHDAAQIASDLGSQAAEIGRNAADVGLEAASSVASVATHLAQGSRRHHQASEVPYAVARRSHHRNGRRSIGLQGQALGEGGRPIAQSQP
jgi:phage-related tail protein